MAGLYMGPASLKAKERSGRKELWISRLERPESQLKCPTADCVFAMVRNTKGSRNDGTLGIIRS
jgi:hypothetical protein